MIGTALVAENESLKSFIGGCYTFDGHIADESDLYVDALDSKPETPATDAAIAEINKPIFEARPAGIAQCAEKSAGRKTLTTLTAASIGHARGTDNG